MKTGILCVVLLLVATGCGGTKARATNHGEPSARTSARAGASATGSPSPTGFDQQLAQRDLDRAVRNLVTEKSTAFGFRLEAVPQGPLYAIKGELVSSGWTSRTEFFGVRSAEKYMVTRAVGGKQWMQMEGWPAPAAGCWLTLGSTQVPLGIQALLAREPGYVSVVGVLKTHGYLSASSSGSRSAQVGGLSLAAVANLLTVQVIQKLGLSGPNLENTEVPASIEIVDGHLRSLVLEGRYIAKAIDAAGINLDQDLEKLVQSLRLTVLYEHGAGAPVSAPPVGLQYDAKQDGCH